MYIFIFFFIFLASLYLTNKLLKLGTTNSLSYEYKNRDTYIVIGFLVVSIILQKVMPKGKVFWIGCAIYAGAFLITLTILGAIKRITVEKQRQEIQSIFEVLEPVIPTEAKVKDKETQVVMMRDPNNPPFKLGYEGIKVNRITIKINPNTFKETVAVNLCLSLNKYLPNYEWVNEFDFAARECIFVGTPLPPKVAKYKGSWLRPPEFIPIGLSGLGEVSWNLNSFKNAGRSCYVYEDGKIAQTVDTPSAPQALCVGSPLGLDTIVPTTKGYKTVATIDVGDEVFGFGNKPVKVLAVYEIHESSRLYGFNLISMDLDNDDGIAFYADDVHKLAILKNDEIRPVPASEVKIGDIVPGSRSNYFISYIQEAKNKPVRCFMINSDSHLFLFTDTKHDDWFGGQSYPFDAAYIYQTGGGKAVYVNQEVEVQSDEV